MHITFFDIDGTLIKSGGAGKEALETALLEDFEVPNLRREIPYSGRTDRAIISELLQVHNVDATSESIAKLIAGYLQRLPAALKKKKGEILPGISDLVRHLHSLEHIHLGLLTGNTRRGAQTKLGHFGLFDFFAFGGFGDEHVERDNVAREALDAARNHLDGQFEKLEMWVIGDTPLDVQCARAIGAKAVAVATGWNSPDELRACEPDLLFEDLSDPGLLLELWQ